MIVWGTKSRIIEGRRLNEPCPNCESKSMLSYGRVDTFSIYFVPMFPTSRVAGARCESCKHAYEGKELGAKESKIRDDVFDIGSTLRAFAGSMIAAALIIFGMVALAGSKRKELAYLADPQVNDLYIIDTTKLFDDADSDMKYGLLRVMRVEPTRVVTWVSSTVFSKTRGIDGDIRKRKVWKDSYYHDVPFELERSRLKSLRESDAIDSVERRDDAPATRPLEPVIEKPAEEQPAEPNAEEGTPESK